jgi:hypothetical protein
LSRAKKHEEYVSTLALAFQVLCVGTQFGTQKYAERAVEAVDAVYAVHAVRNFLWKFSPH